jgi:hypothetical protein
LTRLSLHLNNPDVGRGETRLSPRAREEYYRARNEQGMIAGWRAVSCPSERLESNKIDLEAHFSLSITPTLADNNFLFFVNRLYSGRRFSS